MRAGQPLAALLAWLALAPAAADAASLGISPLRLDLRPDQRVASVTVRNDDARPVMIQVRTYAWTTTPATADLQPTRDVLAVPAITTIAPGEQQVVRVAFRGHAAGDAEAAFRLIIAEVPAADTGTSAAVRIALAFSLPIFVTPPGAAPDARWSMVRGPTGLALRVTNQGNAHLRVRSIELSGPAAMQRIERSAYVLPGRQHDWPLSEPPAGPTTLKADTDLGEIDAVVAHSGG